MPPGMSSSIQGPLFLGDGNRLRFESYLYSHRDQLHCDVVRSATRNWALEQLAL